MLIISVSQESKLLSYKYEFVKITFAKGPIQSVRY